MYKNRIAYLEKELIKQKAETQKYLDLLENHSKLLTKIKGLIDSYRSLFLIFNINDTNMNAILNDVEDTYKDIIDILRDSLKHIDKIEHK